jgi:uncharacterized protein Veg
MTKIKVGQKVRFDPFQGINCYGAVAIRKKQTGTVVAVYEDHRWFSVEYGDKGETKKRISFNFADIGVTCALV